MLRFESFSCLTGPEPTVEKSRVAVAILLVLLASIRKAEKTFCEDGQGRSRSSSLSLFYCYFFILSILENRAREEQ
jgi:hypothetical protein